MPRYPANSPNHIAHKRSLVERADYISGPRFDRDLEDSDRRARLYAAAQGIQDFCTTFDNFSLLAVINANMPGSGMDNALSVMEAQLTGVAPVLTRPANTVAGTKVYSAHGKVSDAINILPSLHEYYFGTTTIVPGLGTSSESHASDAAVEWSPPDEAITAVLENMLPRLLKNTGGEGVLARAKEARSRLAAVATEALEDFLDRLTRDGRGGLSLAEVGKRVAADTGKRAGQLQAIHAGLAREVDGLKDALLGGHVKFPELLVVDIRALELAAEDWCQKCLPLLGLKRNTLESKRKVLRGAVAEISRNCRLIQGAAQVPAFLGACWGMKTVAQVILTNLEVIESKVRGDAAAHRETRAAIAKDLEKALVTEAAVEEWRGMLGPDARLCGRLVGLCCQAGGYAREFGLRDHIDLLAREGVLTGRDRRGRERQFSRLLKRMQQAGLAFKMPWDYFRGGRREPPRLSSGQISLRCGKWLLNPLASALADSAI